MLRQTFLLSQYSFICVQYFKCSDIKQLIVSTSLFFILVAKISSKKVYEKMEDNSTLEKVLLVCNRKGELLRLVVDSKMTFLRSIRKKNLIILKSLQKKNLQFLVLFVFRLLTFELSNISSKCSLNCNVLTLNIFITVLYLKFYSIL